MHIGRFQQVFLLMVVWALVLIGVSKMMNNEPVKISKLGGKGKPQIIVTFTHFCCTGCYDKMFSAAKSMNWIINASTDTSNLKKQADLQHETADPSKAIETAYEKDATFQIDENNLVAVDFVKLDQEFRKAGLVPKRIRLENMPHFRLIAKEPHLCCSLCESAAKESLTLEQMQEQHDAQMADPMKTQQVIKEEVMPRFEVNRSQDKITAEFHHASDVTAFSKALERAGFSPKETRVEVM